LWCPLLTHYAPNGALDRDRIAVQLNFISPWVKGLLVPGTTGDAWELTPAETRELIGIVLDNVQRLQLHLLLGALHPDAAQARRIIEENLAMLRERAGMGSTDDVWKQSRVSGFTICPPRGDGIGQEQMRRELSSILELGVPIALYQLPQVTQNEMGPELVADLARRFSNFILFKDTSGTDRVPSSGLDFDGVFLVRGMEGDYARWLKLGGGTYDGLLLATANSFGAELRQIRVWLEAGRRTEARSLSDRLSHLIAELMGIVSGLTDGNKFANAGKAADHFFAYGPQAAKVSAPRLHSGRCLPAAIIRAAGAAMTQHQFMPVKGYLE
jgi:dihydrodipicolinate synthase/N-acetylneuraminate lyase